MVERIFGVYKRRFGFAEAAPEYSTEMQARFVVAFGGVHNYIRIHDPSDKIESWTNNTATQGSAPSARTPQEPRQNMAEPMGINITAAERRRASDRRDHIAQKMWEDYQQILEANEGEEEYDEES